MELFAVQQCSRELPSVMVVRIPSGFKSRKKTLFNSLQKIQTLKTLSLSLKKLKMLKFITALLFAQVLLAAPIPAVDMEESDKAHPAIVIMPDGKDDKFPFAIETTVPLNAEQQQQAEPFNSVAGAISCGPDCFKPFTAIQPH